VSHTPEPWRAEWQPGQTPNHTYTHCVMCGDDSLCDTLTKADAYRIVACVNALAGVADPDAQVTKWRAIEAAAREFVAANDEICGSFDGSMEKLDDLRQVLAAKGGE